jgi:hypothetical protein
MVPVVPSAVSKSAHPIAARPRARARATARDSQHLDFGNGFMDPPILHTPFYRGVMLADPKHRVA